MLLGGRCGVFAALGTRGGVAVLAGDADLPDCAGFFPLSDVAMICLQRSMKLGLSPMFSVADLGGSFVAGDADALVPPLAGAFSTAAAAFFLLAVWLTSQPCLCTLPLEKFSFALLVATPDATLKRLVRLWRLI